MKRGENDYILLQKYTGKKTIWKKESLVGFWIFSIFQQSLLEPSSIGSPKNTVTPNRSNAFLLLSNRQRKVHKTSICGQGSW